MSKRFLRENFNKFFKFTYVLIKLPRLSIHFDNFKLTSWYWFSYEYYILDKNTWHI